MRSPCSSAVLPAGSWSEPEIDEVLIDFDRRFRRRIVLTTLAGHRTVDRSSRRRSGCGMATASCRIWRDRPRSRATRTVAGDSRSRRRENSIRIAWHLGNRHLPVQLLGDRIRIRADHVIQAMVEGLGGHVDAIDARVRSGGRRLRGRRPPSLPRRRCLRAQAGDPTC